MEAGAKGLKQKRTLRKKAEEKSTVTVKRLIVHSVKRAMEATYNKLSEYSFSQITTMLLAFYFIIWPNIKPEMRMVLYRAYARILHARDVFLSGVANRLVGITTTGILLSMRPSPSTSTNGNDGSGTTSVPSGAASLNPSSSAGAMELNPMSTSPSISPTTTRGGTSSRDSTPLSP